MQEDKDIIAGLRAGGKERVYFEKELYTRFSYFIREGCIKYKLSEEDAFSAYSDTILAAIHNIVNERFEQAASLKTYVFKIFSNKCVDLIRKHTTNKEYANRSSPVPEELLGRLPDHARSAVESMISRQKRNIIQEHLARLGEKCKEILLFFEDGYSDKEIAGRLDYSNAAVVKTTRLRCLGKLREQMFPIMDII